MSSSLILVTGAPGAGKTTLVQKIVQKLLEKRPSLKVKGFTTSEVRERDVRVGFDVGL
jgi:nucleoside-triphosphatase